METRFTQYLYILLLCLEFSLLNLTVAGLRNGMFWMVELLELSDFTLEDLWRKIL